MSLKIVNLSKRYKDKWALRDVSFDVAEGEVFGVFGPSNAGKSTLLRAISGDVSTDGGTVVFKDSEVPIALRRSWRFAPERRRFTLGRLFSDQPTLTGSQLLANALASARQVLLLDDPLSTMDLSTRDCSIDKIKTSVRERSLATVFVSSDFEQVLSLCDRAAVLAGTEIKQVGTPRELYEEPRSRLVAALTGRNNLFPARRLTSSKAEIPEFHTLDGGHRLFAQKVDRGSLGAINQNVTLAIRPEYVSISFGASFPEDNLVRARITGVLFLGPTTLVELDADGLKLQSMVLRLVGLNIGDECMVGLPPDRIQTFRD